MKHYCNNCRETSEVLLSEKDEYHYFRGTSVVYKKQTARCAVCETVLEIDSVADTNAKRILDAIEFFNVLCPFD